MIVVALFGLAVMGIVITWEKQLPSAGERVNDLSPKRRAWSLAAIPVSACVIAAFSVAVTYTARADNQPGYGDQMLVFSLGGAALGFAYLLVVAFSRLRKATRAVDSPGDRTT